MTKIVSLTALVAFCISLGACASQPASQADLTPPKQRMDAKTDLEYGKVPKKQQY